MPTPVPFAPEPLRLVLQELLGRPLALEEAQAVAALLAAWTADTAALRAMLVGDAESVLLYEARP